MRVLITINIIMLIVIVWYYYLICLEPKYEKIPYEDLTYNTGDIILMHAYNNINPIFIGSFWGHIGIVYKDPEKIINNGNPVVFEAARTTKMKICPDNNISGVMITDLYTRLSKYPGLIAVKKLNKVIDYNIQCNFKDFIYYAKNNMKYFDNVFLSRIKKKLGYGINNETNCGELVYLSLIKLGLIDLEKVNDKILHHLLYICNIQKVNNNHYNKPVEILFNPF